MRAVFFIAVLLSASLSAAQEAPTDVHARRVFDLGEEAFSEGRYLEAATYFEEAYEISPRAELLFNVGASYQRAGESRRAYEVFEEYQRQAPDSVHSREVGARLRVLRAELEGEDDTESGTEEARPSSSSPSGIPGTAFVLLATGACGSLIGASMQIVSGLRRREVESPAPETFWVDAESEARSVRVLGIAGGVTLGVGLAVALAGIVVWVRNSDGEEDGEENDESTVEMELGVTAGGATLVGRW